MRFSSRSEYGVRVLVRLGRRYGEGPVPLSEIARMERMPLPYLEQIMVSLRRHRLVRSRQGVKGGFELTRPPADIRMSEVVLALEGDISPMVCTVGERAGQVLCELQESCTTQLLWQRIRRSILDVLEGTTLAELLAPPAHAREPGRATVTR
jgi:Rrf2 family cysteine metabolism transcriptional repressor